MGIANTLHAVVDFLCGTRKVGPIATAAGSTLGSIESHPLHAKYSEAQPKIATLSDAIRAYRRNSDEVRERELSNEIVGLAHTFDDWLQVAVGVSSSSPLWKIAEKELAKVASSFEQHEKVYEFSSQPDIQNLALEKMAALAKSLDERLQVYTLAGADSLTGQAIFKQIISEERSYDEWEELFGSAEADSPLEHFAAKKLIEVAETPEALAGLACENQISDTELEQVILTKLRGVAASFEDWSTIASNYDGDIEIVAREKMIDTATTIEEMLEIADEISGDDDFESKLKDKAVRLFVWTDESHRYVLDNHDTDNILFNIALEKMLEGVQTTAEHLKIYFEWDFDEDSQIIIFNKLSSIITPSECSIIALVAEEGSTLQDWASNLFPAKG